MKLELPLVLFLLILTSCKSRTPRSIFNRGFFKECITLDDIGFMACNGVKKIIPSGLIVPETIEDYTNAKNYCEKREYGQYICIVDPDRCSVNP